MIYLNLWRLILTHFFESPGLIFFIYFRTRSASPRGKIKIAQNSSDEWSRPHWNHKGFINNPAYAFYVIYILLYVCILKTTLHSYIICLERRPYCLFLIRRTQEKLQNSEKKKIFSNKQPIRSSSSILYIYFPAKYICNIYVCISWTWLINRNCFTLFFVFNLYETLQTDSDNKLIPSKIDNLHRIKKTNLVIITKKIYIVIDLYLKKKTSMSEDRLTFFSLNSFI